MLQNKNILLWEALKHFHAICKNYVFDAAARENRPVSPKLKDTLVVNQSDFNLFLTTILRLLSIISFCNLKGFQCLLSFKGAWIRTTSRVYIFIFTSRCCNSCFDLVPGNERCLAFTFN